MNDTQFNLLRYLVAPEVTVVEKELRRRRGEDAILECDIVAQPIEEFFWERLSHRLRPSPGKYTLEVSLTSTGVCRRIHVESAIDRNLLLPPVTVVL